MKVLEKQTFSKELIQCLRVWTAFSQSEIVPNRSYLQKKEWTYKCFSKGMNETEMKKIVLKNFVTCFVQTSGSSCDKASVMLLFCIVGGNAG